MVEAPGIEPGPDGYASRTSGRDTADGVGDTQGRPPFKQARTADDGWGEAATRGSMEPAIKGTVMVNLVADVLALREGGRVSHEELAARLERADLEILDAKVLPSSWYPIQSYRRLTELLLEKEGGDEDYLRQRGARSAQRLLEAGLYEQMRRLRPGTAVGIEDIERSVKMLVVMSQTILNFGRGEVLRDPQHEKRVIIEIHDAADYPEVLRFTSEGFYDACVRAAGRRYRWRSTRPSPDRIVMRMDLDFDA